MIRKLVFSRLPLLPNTLRILACILLPVHLGAMGGKLRLSQGLGPPREVRKRTPLRRLPCPPGNFGLMYASSGAASVARSGAKLTAAAAAQTRRIPWNVAEEHSPALV